MGIRVHFSYGAKNGALDHFLSAPLRKFHSALRIVREDEHYEDDEEVMDIVDPLLLLLLDDVIMRGAPSFVPDTFI